MSGACVLPTTTTQRRARVSCARVLCPCTSTARSTIARASAFTVVSMLAMTSPIVGHAQVPQSAAPASAGAENASATRSRLTTGIVFEKTTFSGGILEGDLTGTTTTRVQSATGVAIPLQYNAVINGVWLIDASTSFTNGSRTATNIGASTSTSDALSGLGDVRLRVSRRFDGLGLRLTVGANVPTGVTRLDGAKAAALSVLASPAVGMTQPAVGFGGGTTIGVVKSFASAARDWGVAIGTSFEWRGAYDPFAALAVGASASNYDPGEVVRVSAGASRVFGQSKGTVTASVDLFGTDKVSSGGGVAPTRIQIGPTIALDGQWMPATTALKNVALFGAVQLRSALKRDDVSLPNSGNTTLDLGVRGAKPLSSHTDVVFELSGRVVTAVAIDNRLATAASNSIAPVLGLAITASDWTLQPAVTARIGSINTGVGSGSFTVLGARFLIERRF